MKKILSLALLSTALIWSDFHLQVKSIQNGSEYLLDSGDIVFSRDTLRFSFHSDIAATLKICTDDNKNKHCSFLGNNEMMIHVYK